jgi:hypothetical protein
VRGKEGGGLAGGAVARDLQGTPDEGRIQGRSHSDELADELAGLGGEPRGGGRFPSGCRGGANELEDNLVRGLPRHSERHLVAL